MNPRSFASPARAARTTRSKRTKTRQANLPAMGGRQAVLTALNLRNINGLLFNKSSQSGLWSIIWLCTPLNADVWSIIWLCTPNWLHSCGFQSIVGLCACNPAFNVDYDEWFDCIYCLLMHRFSMVDGSRLMAKRSWLKAHGEKIVA